MGVRAERYPLSGASHYQGKNHDVNVYPFGEPPERPLVAEVKGRKSGDGFTMLDKWLGDHDMLFLRKNHSKPGVYMPWETYERLLEELRAWRLDLRKRLPDGTYEKRVATGDDANEFGSPQKVVRLARGVKT